jgi:hypothetical protein
MKTQYAEIKKLMDEEIEQAAAKRLMLLRRLEGEGMRSLWGVAEQIVEIETEICLYGYVARAFENENVLEALKSFKEDMIEKLLQGPEISSTNMFSNAVGASQWKADKAFLRQIDRYIRRAEKIEAVA